MATAPAENFVVPLGDGREVTVAWNKRVGARSLKMSVSSHGAKVSSPARMPKFLVQQFLNAQKHWLAEHAHVIQALPANTLWFRGSERQVIIQEHQHGEDRVKVDQEQLYLAPVSHTPESAKKTLERWLETQAGLVATPLIKSLATAMKVEVPQLRFRETKSRWGSCSQHGSIMLNWRLIHAPDDVFRYVIVHELAHRTHMNHSAQFWNLVRQFDPSYPIHQGWLKRHASKCATPPLEF